MNAENSGQHPATWTPQGRRLAAQRVSASVVLMIACVVMANFLAIRHSARVTLENAIRHDLSPLSKRVLDGLTNRVRITALFNREETLFEPIKNLLNEYEKASSMVAIEQIDPSREPGRAEALKSQYEVLSNARENLVLFECEGRTRVVGGRALSVLDLSQFMDTREARRTHFKGEQLFSSAIVSVCEARDHLALFTTGHGEHQPNDRQDQVGYSRFAEVLRQKGIQPRMVNLRSTDIPKDCGMLIVAGPRTSFSQDELDKIDTFMKDGGSLLALFNVYSRDRNLGLEFLLKKRGIEVGHDQVIDASNALASQENLMVKSFVGHPVTRPMLGTRIQMLLPRSVSAAEAEEGEPAEASRAVELAHTSNKGQAAVFMGQGKGRVKREGSIPLMVAVEFPENELKKTVSRIVAVGESLFLGNTVIEFEANRDFASLVVNWLLARESLLEIDPRPVIEYRISLTNGEMASVRWILLALLPGGMLAVGAFQWRRQNQT